MINNWDIISRIDPKTQSRCYTLVTDGTEHDARMIAKKLEGYAQPPAPAVAPFVYAFELPSDLDEDTLEKIRTAAAEGVTQTNKVNQFVPGGILGDPLFNADAAKEDKEFPTFMTLDPSESFFRADKPAPAIPKEAAPSISDDVPQAPEQKEVQELEAHRVKLDAEPDTLGLQKQTVAAPPVTDKEHSGEITINDKDMLIKDMEGTMLDQMPLEDIFSAETKYDMFLDLENQKLVKNSQTQREQKITSLADGKDSLEESFNVFEQKIKDQTCIIDLDDLNAVTDRLPKKDMGFVQHAAADEPPAAPATEAPAPQTPAAAASEPETLQNAPEIPDLAVPAPQTAEAAQEAVTPAQDKTPAEDPFEKVEEQAAEEVPSVEDPFEQIEKEAEAKEKTQRLTQPSLPDITLPQAGEPLSAEGAPLPEAETPGPVSASEPAEEEPIINLGPSPEEASVLTINPNETASGIIPEEVAIVNTVPPLKKAPKSISPDEQPEDLPEITIRGQKIDSLDKTFNLETTLNTEIMKHQYEKSFHDTQAAPPPGPKKPSAAPPQTPPSSQEPLREERPKRKVLRLVGKKTSAPEPVTPQAAAPKNLTDVQPGEPIMEENKEEKTTFRIRRKTDSAPGAPMPPVPPAPAAPQPQAPATPDASAVPAAPAPKPAPQAAAHNPAAANTIIEKTKTIDHSIEIPLSELKKHNWPLEVPLVPTYTLENMVMSVNRFAHATAISVIDNPGKLYNPLVLHGATGTGKTHFLNAMAYAFSKKYGQENIFMTNGVRLSRGIQRYVMEGNIEKFEKFMDTVKVLLIDDIHLIAINEQNRVHISKLLNKFLKEQKQIVITSKYPPESLEKLEELIKFKLDSGWISELKPASGAAHFKIVKKMLLDNGVDLNDAQITEFFGGPHMTLGTVTRSVRRLKVLENLIFPHIPESERSQATIFQKLLATAGEDATSEILSRDPDSVTAISTVGNGEWGRIGFFYPQNSSHMMNWMVYALQQRAAELGVTGGFDIAVRSSYATENIISSAFKIANLCDNKKLKGAVILGPALTVCDPSVRENFYDILTHMLEIMLIRCGIINFEDAKAPSTYVKVISELLR